MRHKYHGPDTCTIPVFWPVLSNSDSYVYPEIYSVLMGLNNLAGGEGNTQFIQVSEIFVHPDFMWSEVDSNIALLKLAEPATITDHVRTVCLPEADAVFDNGTMCTATGWGSTETSGKWVF